MTQEQIEAIRKGQSDLRALKDRDRVNQIAWAETNLRPLLDACDHIYPWGESAIRCDPSFSYSSCGICGIGMNR